jgi:DNA polymerase-3 subunit gamma/tau
MSDYQVIARKFRPQSFKEVVGQNTIVTTLKNAMRFKRLAQAYLFCGSRGTGKTTLARLLAKTINCQQPTTEYEPCNQCASCREITAGTSLDVLEIDGASHRGIEDIRQINETVGYAASGHYKIYIIDEVHMLTKEAFNALLKTLEEPPPKVKFFFATTEPHKVPATILSRCQRFNLNRIPLPLIVAKLRQISHQLGVTVEEDALRLLAQQAEGGLRDAESLFDQVLAFEEGIVTVASVTAILGLMPREIYFEIDQAGKEGEFVKAFEIAHRIFSEGKDITFFIEGLIEHLRQILLVKVSGVNSSFMTLTDLEKEQYKQAADFYSREQCFDLIEYLLEAQNQLRLTAFSKISLEAILLHVMRSHFRLSIEQIVCHLSELEQMMNEKNDAPLASSPPPLQTHAPLPLKPSASNKSNQNQTVIPTVTPKAAPPANPSPPAAKPNLESPPIVKTLPKAPNLFDSFISEDPTPSPADLGKNVKAAKSNPTALPPSKVASPTSTSQPLPSNNELEKPIHAYDTLMHFAAVELEGRLQKN